jgi:hypothetical protein
VDQGSPCLQVFNFIESIGAVRGLIGFFHIEVEHLQKGVIG